MWTKSYWVSIFNSLNCLHLNESINLENDHENGTVTEAGLDMLQSLGFTVDDDVTTKLYLHLQEDLLPTWSNVKIVGPGASLNIGY